MVFILNDLQKSEYKEENRTGKWYKVAVSEKDLITAEEIKIVDNKLEICMPACTGMIIKLK